MSRKEQSFESKGADWYVDRYDAIRVERNRYFVILIICFGALLASVIANLLLSPLKTAVPYVIEVNKANGLTTVLKPMDMKSIEENQAISLYFLYKYINARMGYNYGLRNTQAETIRLLSAAPVFQAYARQMDISNPESPVRRYKNNAEINTKILSYSFPDPNIAQLHFYTEINNVSNNNTPKKRIYWQATIKFTYANTALPLAQRIDINPVGFFVTDFQANPEIPVSEVKI